MFWNKVLFEIKSRSDKHKPACTQYTYFLAIIFRLYVTVFSCRLNVCLLIVKSVCPKLDMVLWILVIQYIEHNVSAKTTSFFCLSTWKTIVFSLPISYNGDPAEDNGSCSSLYPWPESPFRLWLLPIRI